MPLTRSSQYPDVRFDGLDLRWLVRLRWAAVGGQLATVLTARLWVGAWVPLGALLGILGLEAASNVALGRWLTRRGRRAGTVALRAAAVWVDVGFLSALLYVTGGLENPFRLFYLVHIVLAAVLLPPRWAWATCALVLGAYGSLAQGALPLVRFSDGLPLGPEVVRLGKLVALGTAAGIAVYFVTRVRGALQDRERELSAARERAQRIALLEGLATLAAGAAHELATPLMTIAVAAKELEALAGEGALSQEAAEDARLVLREVGRCRKILDRMALTAGETVGEGMVSVPLAALLVQALEGLRPDGAAARVSVVDPEAAACRLVFGPRTALVQALRALVQNALDASPGGEPVRVEVAGALDDDAHRIRIVDQGQGMEPSVLARVGEPFFTTKEPGRGMGLGLHLARAVIERSGGRLDLRSTPGVGTTAEVALPGFAGRGLG